MKPEKILRTIEYHMGLKPGRLPKIKEDSKYLKDINASGATIKIQGEGTIILVENKKDMEVLAEELTHFVDLERSKKMPIENYEDFFYNQALQEALGYYSSKTLTQKREPIRIRKRLKKNIEKKDWESLKKAYTVNYKLRRAWHEVGYDLGEKIYHYVQKTHDKKPALGIILKNRYKEKPFEVYKRILEQVTK